MGLRLKSKDIGLGVMGLRLKSKDIGLGVRAIELGLYSVSI